MTATQQPSVTQADKCLIWDVRQSESTEEAWDYAARHREQSTADLRAENDDLKQALQEADGRHDAILHEWNNCIAENERLREALERCAETPHSGWTIAQSLARAAQGEG